MKHTASAIRFRTYRAVLAVTGICFLAAPVATATGVDDHTMSATVARRIAAALGDRRIESSATWPGEMVRSARDVFRQTASAVPFVIAQTAMGSSAVVYKDDPSGLALIVTNEHVVASAFLDEKTQKRYVWLLFYEPILATGTFDESRIRQCFEEPPEPSRWCSSLLKSIRVGVVLSTDPVQDLALLAVEKAPPAVRSIPFARLDSVQPGDDVIVIGHPLGFLWTVTTGIVSGIRSSYSVGKSSMGITVVQTQTPVNPGNSGGPLLTSDGRLAGIIALSSMVRASTESGSEVAVAAAGLNLAIGVNEVERFLSKQLQPRRGKPGEGQPPTRKPVEP